MHKFTAYYLYGIMLEFPTVGEETCLLVYILNLYLVRIKNYIKMKI